ncbi:MAG: hypothetical protein GXY49_09040 [Syntrophomonadaceae bacterium]|nr:hypothetical protein [Syntrophomonadaceae bacterium]
MKKFFFSGLVISLVCLVTLMVNNTEMVVHTAAYESLVEIYGRTPLLSQDSKIFYSPGLRRLPGAQNRSDIYTGLPGIKKSNRQQMEEFMCSDAQMIVECSGLDGWHTSREGSAWLPVLRNQAYRVVVFDGGHHLPTLGLAPDIIIVPSFRGYAVHGYMQDGMRVDKILEILTASHIPTAMATVSRWRLVKTDSSLQSISREILNRLDFADEEPEPFKVNCRPRISKYGGYIFIYANEEYIKQPDLVTKYCRQLGLDDVCIAYIAFDYAVIKPTRAGIYAQKLQQEIGVKTEIVNEPVKTSSLLLRFPDY